ncbi:autotransporter-associated beta strand repeat-containing protein [Acidiphilium sp. C61]|uniref:autotransporter-associated beta strand repeat-containing protein n=2 Tax=unclassified Acidiphilium TaxID=2617493 RepID=UPI00157BA5F4|nr:autotransporter-associated beta strand repeat-containing protein [Acidiphilium sp. C61]
MLTFAGVFSDASGSTPGYLVISDSGQGGAVILDPTAANTFTGGVQVQAGATLQIANGDALGAGTVQLLGTATTPAVLNVTSTTTISNAIQVQGDPTYTVASGQTVAQAGQVSDVTGQVGDVVVQGGGTLLLQPAAGATNTYTGGTDIENGTLQVGNAGALPAGSASAVPGTAVSGAVEINTTGAMDLNNISQTISMLGDGSNGGGNVILGSATLTIQNGATSASTYSASTPYSNTFSGYITGTGGITIAGGYQALSGNTAYQGATTVDAGSTLALSGNGYIAGSYGVLDSGTFDVSGLNGPGGSYALAPIQSLSGAGAVTLGNNILQLNGANGNFSGSIGGSGGLTVNGGTETLAGVNAYTGVTTINVGSTLALSGSGSIASSSGVADGGTFDISAVSGSTTVNAISGAGNVVLGGNGLTVANATGSLSGAISGTGGSLTIAGGTQTLAGTNTYTGGTTVDAGSTLAVSGSGSIAFSSGVADSGTFDISAANGPVSIKSLSGAGGVTLGSQTLQLTNASGSYSGAISGSGNIIVSGGTETLSGVNTYTGGTAITADTLALSGSGSIASSAGITDAGAFDISALTGNTTVNAISGAGNVVLGGNGLTVANATGSLSGAISGTGGSLTIAGGTQTLSGTNTYTGGTTVDAGAALSFASSSSLGTGALNLVGNATTPATVYVTGTTTIANPIYMTGDPDYNIATGTATTISSVIANGASAGDLVLNAASGYAGTLVLTNQNTYTGLTTIDAGTLALTGTGSIADSSAVTNNAILDISQTTAPVSLAGSYTQSNTGSLVVRVSPSVVAGSGFSQIDSAGSAALAGNLAVQTTAGTYTIGSHYDVIHTVNGVAGQFTSQSLGYYGPYIVPSVQYQPSDVYIVLNPQPALVESGRAYVASRFAMNEALFQAADATLGGYSGFGRTDGSVSHGAWMQGLGGFGTANGFSFHTGGFVAGRGFEVSPHWSAGVGVQSLFTDTSGMYGTVNDTQAGVTGYGIYHRGHVRVSFSESFGDLINNFKRSVPQLGIGARAGGSGLYDVTAARLSYDWHRGRFFVAPAAEAAYVHTQANAVSETGGGALGLTYAALNTDVGRIGGSVTAGMELHRRYGTVEPFVSVGGYGSVGQRHYTNVERLQQATSVQAANVSASAGYTGGVGVRVIGKGHWRGDVHWGGSWGDSTNVQNLGVDVNYAW